MAKYRFTILFILFIPYYLFSFQSTIQVDSNVVSIYLSAISGSDNKAYSSDSSGCFLRYVFAAHRDYIPTIAIDAVQYKAANLQDLDSAIRVDSILKILNAKIDLIGTYRGLDLYALRIDLLKKNKKKLQMLSQGNFPLTFPSSLIKNYKYDIGSFSALSNQLINPEHIPFLLHHIEQLKTTSNYSNSKVSNWTWYNPEIDYITLNTYKDGIGAISASKLLEIQPNLQGKSYSHFHLTNPFAGHPTPLVSLGQWRIPHCSRP